MISLWITLSPYYTAYAIHNRKEVGKLVAEMKYGKGEVPKLSEEQVADPHGRRNRLYGWSADSGIKG